MKHSKYNPKYDPKHSSYQLQATAPVDQIPVVTPVANTPRAQVATSLQAVRKPSALTGGLPELPAAQTDSETGEKAPGLSAKSIS